MNPIPDTQVATDESGQTGTNVIPIRETIAPLAVEAAMAAHLCGVSRATWYSLRKAGRIPRPVRLGRRVLWRIEELQEWMAAGCPPCSRWDAMKKGRSN
jgi:predicted DNA-binding transcriptional regulator AlpA